MSSTRGDTVGIVGAGTFGTALASVVARAGRRVVLWSRDEDVVDQITRERRCARLPAAELPAPLTATADPRELARAARLIVLAVVSTDVAARARELGEVLDGSHLVVHAVGALAALDPGAALDARVSEVVAAGTPTLRLGALAGPALPADLASGQYASMVVASRFEEVRVEARRLLGAPPVLRVYASADLIGVELASALACAYTVALGLADGLGLGPGPRAVLVTRAIAEGGRLIAAAGGEARSMAGLAGLGNLLVRAAASATADAPDREPDRSADYALGRRLAAGEPTGTSGGVPLALVSEGARAAAACARLAARYRVRAPLLAGVAGVLDGSIPAGQAAALAADSVADVE
ncbi:MAG: NAD(P)-binding domain-containing protein [Kofleriaceae bacterium]